MKRATSQLVIALCIVFIGNLPAQELRPTVTLVTSCVDRSENSASVVTSSEVSQELVGKRITIHGNFSLLGNVGPSIALDNRQKIYLSAKESFEWGKSYTEMDGKLVAATGTLRFYHAPDTKKAVQLPHDFFYFEVETSQLRIIGSASSIHTQEVKSDDAWKRIASWREPMPRVTVLSGNELMIDGIRCRLFGVKLPKDIKIADTAKRFLELYVKDYGRYYSIYNTDSPVSSDDGVPLIWLAGNGEGGWAQETLVQAGLLDVDYGGFEEYHFRVPTKTGLEEFDWKGCFKKALASHQAGKKPHILFDWPEPIKK